MNVINGGEISMGNFRFNLKGKINEIQLHEQKSLWPLYEAVVNSIQSIEDSENANLGKILIRVIRDPLGQFDIDDISKPKINSFEIIDNGQGFNSDNYKSFLEAYTDLKVSKGCKGIGRFLWLKVFENATISSSFKENEVWYSRNFKFDINNNVSPDENLLTSDIEDFSTRISLHSMKDKYKKTVTHSTEIIANRLIEHCLIYFILKKERMPQILIEEQNGETYNLNKIFNDRIKDKLAQDRFSISGTHFTLYHLKVSEGISAHELHLCANEREVKSIDLETYLVDLKGRIKEGDDEKGYYYTGYLVSEYLDENVNSLRTDFYLKGDELLAGISEKELLGQAVTYIKSYLSEILGERRSEKVKRVDSLIENVMPKYRYVVNKRPQVYDKIPHNATNENIEIELHKAEQEWETEILKEGKEIEKSFIESSDNYDYQKIFDKYLDSLTELSKSSLAEYITRRKAFLLIFEKALEKRDDDKFNLESTIHKIICPMNVESGDIDYNDMNLWIVDDKLAYHKYLASDKRMDKLIDPIKGQSKNRADILIYNNILSFSQDDFGYSSISLIEFKRPQRNQYGDNENPINQVLEYVDEIRTSKVTRDNGRPFGNVDKTAFYCYIIADITELLNKNAKVQNLTLTPDGQGYFGYNSNYNTYIEIISYDKLLADAKKRNAIFFENLFNPHVKP